jgi:two-component system cell cycle sensor histidine kinase PleC
MKSRFLANMSHELRTPLNCILGFTEMMQKGLFGEIGNKRYADYIDTIRHSGEHLLILINNLLDLSKIEAGHEEVDEDIVDILELLQATAQAEEPTAREHGVALACTVAQHPRLLRADRVKLEQIVLNLLSNAIKFTPEGGKVTLHGKLTASGGYEITVVDTGCGMDQEDIPQAMGSFAQIRNPYQRKQDRGTGLGLPIARGLAELHGGSLEITSRRGFGTQVTVLLPDARVVDKLLGPVMARASAGRPHQRS